MKNRIFNISTACLSFAFLLVPYKQEDSSTDKSLSVSTTTNNSAITNHSIVKDLIENISEASVIYDSIHLEKTGLKKEIFEYALKGYETLTEENKINRSDIITICDFSQSSRRKRMYVVDIANYKLLMQTHVAHGKNSGKEYATRFSNKPESLQSSLGFYVTRTTYYGGHGLALTIDGMEPGINDKARRRKIVVHGSAYVGNDYLRFSKYIGRSFGCPAVPAKQSRKIINIIKNGTCFFIYHPTKKYIAASKILND
jgi:L,D-transpeptidase catalytic domain